MKHEYLSCEDSTKECAYIIKNIVHNIEKGKYKGKISNDDFCGYGIINKISYTCDDDKIVVDFDFSYYDSLLSFLEDSTTSCGIDNRYRRGFKENFISWKELEEILKSFGISIERIKYDEPRETFVNFYCTDIIRATKNRIKTKSR